MKRAPAGTPPLSGAIVEIRTRRLRATLSTVPCIRLQPPPGLCCEVQSAKGQPAPSVSTNECEPAARQHSIAAGFYFAPAIRRSELGSPSWAGRPLLQG